MNTYLLNLIGKLTGIVVLSTVSLFSINNVTEEINIKGESDVNEVHVEPTLEVRQDELIYKEELEEPIIQEPIIENVIEPATGIIEEPITEIEEEPIVEDVSEEKSYNGMLTGYGPDCYGCSGEGNLFCHTKKNTVHSLVSDSIYYEDEEYGIVRILSADQREFPCGTIIEISNSMFDKEIGVVLDTGSGMRNAYDNGWILIDLAFEKEALAHTITNKETNFIVKRVGW